MRICTKEEKKLLYRNKRQVLKGINKVMHNDGWGLATLTSLLSVFLAIGVSIPVVIYCELSNSLLVICLMVADTIINIALWILFSNLQNQKRIRVFLKQKNLFINGVTVIDVYEDGRFSYIEDNFKDKEGNPIVLIFPSESDEINISEVGNRLVVIYDENGNYQLFKLNEELRDLIPNYSAEYPFVCNLENSVRVYHPNMLQIDKEEQELTEKERQIYTDLYVKITQGITNTVVKVLGGIIITCFILICVLISFAEDGVPLIKSIPIAAIIFVGICVLFLPLALLGRRNIRRQGQFVSKQEVIFQSYIIEGKIAKVTVYEWVDGMAEVREYDAGNVYSKTRYGTIIYKFTNQNGIPVLLNTQPKTKK